MVADFGPDRWVYDTLGYNPNAFNPFEHVADTSVMHPAVMTVIALVAILVFVVGVIALVSAVSKKDAVQSVRAK